ncbi:site-2 protease family protein [Ancylobacter dichloromethanicus]|uniref:Zinc metalloprotease n=1 Tax=Ancylobacter dichloromethanicus TaxID=518825 RepID=A0A9W6N1R1_9HYPH|nr:site-2 protease family protein [Ancylobacter dichloromethanicus]MBS7556535.1 site-2 protease family protein [Ancylobacter dichloromethanicus]GLK74292.1 protease [Ancylobacter dichloromethanicus]
MPWSLTVGYVYGTAVRIHVTFLLFLAWIWVAYYQRGGAGAAWEGVAFVALLFLCVLLHEFGHIFAARRYGVKTPEVTLWPFGGIARLERIPEKPSEELVVAIAGPAVNVVIAAVLLVFLGGHVGVEHIENIENPQVSLLAKLAAANIFLVVFNLIPAFPMDGGRVLRALLAMKMSHAQATQTAASIGQGLAIGLGVLGIFGNPMLIIIAVFVFLAASGEAGQVQMKQVAQGLLVEDAMITQFETLGSTASVGDAAEALIRTTQKEFPIVDGAVHLRGVLTRDAMIRALQAQGPGASVLEAMQADVPTVGTRTPLDRALALITQRGAPVIGVVDAGGRLVGLLSPENVGEMMMLRAAQPDARFGPWAKRPAPPRHVG